MKKKFLSVLLALAMCLTLLPTTALANDEVDYTLYLTSGGEAYKGKYEGDQWGKEGNAFEKLPDNLTYDEGLWTMDDFSFTTSAATAVVFDGNTVLELVGENTVTSTYEGEDASYGIYACDALEILGDGSLSATGGHSTYYQSYGIYVNDGNMTVSGGTVTANGGTADYDDSYGIYVDDGNMTVSGGSVTVGNTTATLNYGIYVNENMNIFDGDITVKNCSWNVCMFGKYNFGESDYADSAGSDYMNYTGILTALGKEHLHYRLFTDVHGLYTLI